MAAPPRQRSTDPNEPGAGAQHVPVERGRRDRETVLGHAPAGQGMWFCDHQVGIDVLDSQSEFGFGGVWAEHRDDAAPKADRNARGDGVPRVVGLDEGGRRGRMDGRDPVGQRAGRLDDLANGVRTEFVHDRNLIRRAPGPARPFPVQVLSSP